MNFDVETVVIGAGVVGLAVARALAMAGQDVLIIEQHDIIGSETSARNSEVIHAGIYYPTDSLKAKACVRGKQMLYDFCQSHGVPHSQLGKIIVATNDAQRQALENIRQHADQNGVRDLKVLDARSLQDMEPELQGIAGLFSPSTGIVDSHSYMLALQGDAENCGAQVAFNTRVAKLEWRVSGGFDILCHGAEDTVISAKNAIVSAGLMASQVLATLQAASPVEPTYYAKGNYFRLNGKAPFSHLIYPVPEPGGLGVHLTLDLSGQARFGPDVEWIDEINYEVDAKRGDKFYGAVRQYWPGLPDNALQADYSGIRPKLSRQGEPNADFKIWSEADHGVAGLIGLQGIESPGLTSSLALAEMVLHRFTGSPGA